MTVIKIIRGLEVRAFWILLFGSIAGLFLVSKSVTFLSTVSIVLSYGFGLAAVAFVLWGYNRIVFRLPKSRRLIAIAGMTIFSIVTFGAHALPAQAQFLNGAEDLFTSLDVDEDLVAVVFNLLRIALVIAFAVSLLPAFNAARDGDDWKALAKPPVLAAVLIAVSDAVVELIAG